MTTATPTKPMTDSTATVRLTDPETVLAAATSGAPAAFAEIRRRGAERFAEAGLPMIVVGGYVLVMVMTLFAPKEIVGLAYDLGGVTTSTVTVPLVTALGVGLARTIRGRNPLTDGFGLIALASLTPMIFVMVLGLFVH